MKRTGDYNLPNLVAYAYGHAAYYFGLTEELLLAAIETKKDVDDLRDHLQRAQELAARSLESIAPQMATFIEVAVSVVAAFTRGTERFECWPTSMLIEKLAHDQKWLPIKQSMLNDAQQSPSSPSIKEWIERGLDERSKEDVAEYQSHIANILPILQLRGLEVPV